MTIPYLSPQDEHYCQLRIDGFSPTYAAMISRDFPMVGVSPQIGAVNEASEFIHARFIELGRPDLVPAFEHPAPRMRGIEEVAAKKVFVKANLQRCVSEWLDNTDDPQPFDGLKTLVMRDQ